MKRFLILVAASLAASALAAQSSVSVVGSRAIKVQAPSSTGLSGIVVVENAAGSSLSYSASGAASSVTWQRYSNLGGGYAEDVVATTDGAHSMVTLGADDMGYIITDGSKRTYIWVVNYANHAYDVDGISVVGSDCDRVQLHVENPALPIYYFTINGRREELDRAIELSYTSLEFSQDDMMYVQQPVTESYVGLSETITAPVPLCDTPFTLRPDRFATEWGTGAEVQSETFLTTAVRAETKTEQTVRESDNEQKLEAELGGSAPCEVTFRAAVTDAAIYHRWELSTYPEFDDVSYTDDQLEFVYEFTEAGMTYVRFVANNAEGTCEYISDTYTVTVGDSRLDCPNAFSPGTSEGVNDEWKVSYRSIISFDCHIVNRWGQEMAHLTDPSQGWDGKHGGKIVGSGVYYYVIKAVGSDGKKYNLSGDINVINSRKNTETDAVVE